MKCSCGCNEFYAQQILYVNVIVDGHNNFLRNEHEKETDNFVPGLDIYDCEAPYGPFICVNCGEVYDKLEG
jgi:hypothetical protein